MQSIFILGRQPALGLAELESLLGAEAIRPIRHSSAAVADIEPDRVNFRRLGGSIKFGKVLTVIDSTDWPTIERHLVDAAGGHAAMLPEGKLSVGLSAYGFAGSGRGGLTTQRLLATGLTIKKAVRQTGRPVRLVPNKELELNSASVLHNDLTGQNGWELLLVRDGPRTILAQTIAAQDIDSYTQRDRGRPKRDARVGMLPPKLAQTIINLAVGAAKPSSEDVILDPFCGTGVMLQEALLMGFSAWGTDLEPRMIEYSTQNLEWAARSLNTTSDNYRVDVGDATEYKWEPAPAFVAGESYLGRPFTSAPSPEILNQTVSDCNLIIKKFLRNIGTQITRGTRMCLAVPAWQTRSGQFRHLPLIDSLAELGYNRISFEHVRNEELIYFRKDQVVARQLLVLSKS